MMKIAILGHGTVGSGVAEVLTSHAESIARRAKEEIEIKYILDIRDFPDSPLHDRFVKDFQIILNDPEVTIVAEVMGGLHPAFDFVKACLENGKSVVTSNKELVAAKGAELLSIAQKKNLNFLFEASVGGGIPIIRPISQCLAANEVLEIAGILNGTTNFILTKMIRDSMSFEDALAIAGNHAGRVRPVFHCFIGDTAQAARIFDGLDGMVSFTGVATFKNAPIVAETARWCPEDRIMLETDSPYLSPEPLRGRMNEPAHLIHTARFIAVARGMELEELARLTTRNAGTFYNLCQQ